jgi:long-subunit acyl-CoA synthetase (AMP-forming)
MPDTHILGTRQGEEFKWTSWKQLAENVDNLGKGLLINEFCPQIQAEGKLWRFIGIQAKNREEWFTTMLASMSVNITTVAFYDTLGENASMYMVN